MRKRFSRRTLLVLAGGSLAALSPLASLAQDVPPQIRSTTDARWRLPDEHDRPYFRETQSHRGWEIREPQYTVFATTSPDDARWAAAHVAAAWSNAGQLASRFTQVQSNPDFGLSALQVVIDDEPLRDRDGPLTTVNVVGIQSQVQINVAPGQPPLKDQVVRLREATALAMLHTAGVDSAAPPWVVAGIAAYAGKQGLSDQQIAKANQLGEFAQLGGQQWRFQRESQDVLAYQKVNQVAADAQAAFLLAGNDGQNAPEFLAALSQANTGAAKAAAEGGAFRNFPGDAQLASNHTPFDALMAERQSQFETWQKEPRAGQPIFEPAEDLPPEIAAAEAEMVVLLKLYQRLAGTAGMPAKTGGTTTYSGSSRVKIVTFGREQAAATAPTRQPASSVPALSFADLVARLTDPAQPVWATLDVDGRLLLSTDVARVAALLAAAEDRYSLETSGGKTTLIRRLENGQAIRGWLADNPNERSRPLAKFEIARTQPKRPAAAAPAQKQARTFVR